MIFTIKMPLTVNICLYFYLTLMSSTLVMVHPIVLGVWLGHLGLGPTLDLSQARHKYLDIFEIQQLGVSLQLMVYLWVTGIIFKLAVNYHTQLTGAQCK